jgi:hypothetical protein
VSSLAGRSLPHYRTLDREHGASCAPLLSARRLHALYLAANRKSNRIERTFLAPTLPPLAPSVLAPRAWALGSVRPTARCPPPRPRGARLPCKTLRAIDRSETRLRRVSSLMCVRSVPDGRQLPKLARGCASAAFCHRSPSLVTENPTE